ncbi:RNA methyltransferase [Bermanella sp. WJH001]|uniref:RNA methyltransferase n=1 Tax=Bermanella sp. WJH001 TaxID=3048005 RepID=UPI0024BDAB7A|nr:RNA methyltransferase [Bermanella sp. WJH001]MDJ1536863.1 RNA methyltransferase [Bermanella sp. WJH001]
MNKEQVSIGLINPKDAQNVGSVLRAIGCYQADDIYYTGNRYAYALKHNTDTHNIQSQTHITKVDDLLNVPQEHMSKDTKIICIELVEGATPLPEFEHPESALYIFGPEDGNIAQKIINQADEVVYIPTIGCMNLAATANVVLYDRLAKSLRGKSLIEQGDELIRSSRDGNNHLKVKQ